MLDVNSPDSLDIWLDAVRLAVRDLSPELRLYFETYAAETRFGRQYIDKDIVTLNKGAHIIEVGAGSLLLSCQLMREGFQVTALEPTGDGFSHFEQLRAVIFNKAVEMGCAPAMLAIPAEQLSLVNTFDYAFSVNVMEHVDDVEAVIINVNRSLVSGACFRFTCANYLFPYEPHFNIPIFFTKKMTALIMKEKIFGCTLFPDPNGTWNSLNWITVYQVRKIVRKISGLGCELDRGMLVSTFERVAVDKDFANRRPPILVSLIKLMVYTGLHKILWIIPPLFQPMMNFKLKKLY